MHCDSTTIIQLLSKGSSRCSGKIMEEGIGQYLSWVAENGEKEARQSSLRALYSLFMAAPDHADRHRLLPRPAQHLGSRRPGFRRICRALRLLIEIVEQSPHSMVIESGIVIWPSPRHSITNMEFRKYVFSICQLLAQTSDAGRQALIDAEVLPALSFLATSHIAMEVVSACKILKALAHSGTFRNAIISANLKAAMEGITRYNFGVLTSRQYLML